MGIFDSFFGKRRSVSAKTTAASLNLAFVLLSEPRQPGTHAIAEAFREFALPELKLEIESDGFEDPDSLQVATLSLNSGEKSFVALMPSPVPNREAEAGVEFSLSRWRKSWELPPYRAHLIVTFHSLPASPPIDRLANFNAILAAVTKAT